MGNIHKTLSDDNFRNSKYIEIVNKQMGCDDFSKSYQKEYSIMLDIELYNCFFSDSNS